MSLLSPRGRSLCLITLIAGSLAVSGCTKSLVAPIGAKPEHAMHKTGMPPHQAHPSPQGPPSCTIVVYPTNEKPMQKQFPLTGPMLVSQALEKSGANKKFGRMKVSIHRQLPGGQGRHKMDVSFRSGGKKIVPTDDYTIYPGDRLVVIEDNSTALDDMLEKATAPLGASVIGHGHGHRH